MMLHVNFVDVDKFVTRLSMFITSHLFEHVFRRCCCDTVCRQQNSLIIRERGVVSTMSILNSQE